MYPVSATVRGFHNILCELKLFVPVSLQRCRSIFNRNMSAYCESDAMPMQHATPELRSSLKRALPGVNEDEIEQVFRKLNEMGVHDIEDLKLMKMSDVENLPLKNIQRRRLKKHIDELNGIEFQPEPERQQTKNVAMVISARGSDEAKIRLINSKVTLKAGDGEQNSGTGDGKNTALLAEGNINLHAENSPIIVGAGDEDKPETSAESGRTFN